MRRGGRADPSPNPLPVGRGEGYGGGSRAGLACGRARRLEAEALEGGVDGLEVLPGLLLLVGIAQQVGWVERRHELDALVGAERAAQAGDRRVVAEAAL